ncbi:hypothetical protein ABIC03_002209 [Bradyrhizobium sp. RT6a]
MLIERVSVDFDLNPFATAGDDREYGRASGDHPYIMLQLCHMRFGGGLLHERPGQHELGLEHRSSLLDDAIECCGYPFVHRIPNALLDVRDGLSCRALVSEAIEDLCYRAELDDEIIREIFWCDLSTFLLPKAGELVLVVAHDDTRIRAADEVAAVIG